MTVGSLAIRATRRPSIVARPVTTPSAPSPSSSQLASSPSSAKEPGSTRRSTRSRTGSLPCSAVFSWWRCGPPARAASRAFAKSVTGGSLFGSSPRCQSTGPARSTWAPSGRPSTSCAAREASIRRGRSIPVSTPISCSIETTSSVETLPVDARRHRAAAELAEARLEGLDPLLQRRQHVGQPLAAGVVEVGGQLDPGEALAGGGEELVRPGAGSPSRWCRRSRPRRSRPRRAARRSRRRAPAAPRPRRGSRRRSRSRPRSAAPPRGRVASVRSSPSSDSSIERLTLLAVVGLRGGEEDADLVEAVAHLQRPLEPALVRDQDREGDALAPLHRGQHLARRRRAAGSRRAARRRSPRSASARSPRACRSAAPSRRSGSSPARSGSRREARPRGSARCWAAPPWLGSLEPSNRGSHPWIRPRTGGFDPGTGGFSPGAIHSPASGSRAAAITPLSLAPSRRRATAAGPPARGPVRSAPAHG